MGGPQGQGRRVVKVMSDTIMLLNSGLLPDPRVFPLKLYIYSIKAPG